MSLRRRLHLAFGVVLVVVLVGAGLLLRTQQASLLDELDRQLEAVGRRALFVPSALPGDLPEPLTGALRPGPPNLGDDAPISDLFLGIVADGALEPLVAGQLLADVPLIDGADLDRAGDPPFTVDGAQGSGRFRVVLQQPEDTGSTLVVALPLDEVDRAMETLTRTLAILIAVVVAALLLMLWWVERLGLRPVAVLTATAEAIAAGDRTRRVDPGPAATEAGRLSHAFNVMLDQKDASEGRLRRFVADASHELRTPLTSIRGYLDLRRQGGFAGPGELDDMLRRISGEASRMHELVEDLLLLARLDQHRPLRREPVDLFPLLVDVASDARVLQPDRPVRLALGEPADDLVVEGDAYRLQQVAAALVNNALTHTPARAELTIKAEGRPDSVRFVVQDAGPGMSPDLAEHAFERFHRGEGSRSRRSGGSGLGLAIARSIVEAHHGSIELVTAPGQGCSFQVEVPRTQPREQPPDDSLFWPIVLSQDRRCGPGLDHP